MTRLTRQVLISPLRMVAVVLAFTCAPAVVVFDAAGGGQAARPTPARELYQQALHQEDGAGNLEAAIRLYRQVLASSPERSLAADTELHIGLCLHKLGRTDEARRAFETVVRDYADQAGPATEARTRLARATSPKVTGTGVEAIQLWSGNDIEGATSLSPDGRYLVYSSWSDNGNLQLKDLTTGTVRAITRDAAVRTNGAPQPWSPKFSRDGARIAFSWYEGMSPNTRTSLRITDRDGSNLRTLVTDAGMDGVLDWSPGDRALAISLYRSGQSRLAIVSLGDGAVVPLKSTGWRKVDGARFSPDGKYLVYSLPPAENAESGVFVIAVDGSTETRLIDGRSPAWTPDGRGVVFFSTRSGTSDLWLLPVAGGKAAGTPSIMRRNIGGTNNGFTRDGRLFYETRSEGRDLLVARIDPGSGRPMQTTSLTDAFVGSNGAGAFSADGRYVAFVRGADRATKLVIRTMATGEERTLTTVLTDGLVAHNQGIRWGANGRSLLIRERTNGRIALKRVDVQTGSDTVVFDAAMTAWARFFDVSPDGRLVYYVHRDTSGADGVRFRVVRRDLETGQEAEVYRPGGPGRVLHALSPDGRQLAIAEPFKSGSRLVVVPAAGGTAVEVPNVPASFEPLAWTADGRYIVGSREDAQKEYLCAIPAAGGDAVDLGVTGGNINHVSVSPVDGRAVISVMRPSHELWVVKNLLETSTPR